MEYICKVSVTQYEQQNKLKRNMLSLTVFVMYQSLFKMYCNIEILLVISISKK